MTRGIVVFFLGCLILLHSGRALGRQDPVPGSRYTSGRAAAMGDAFLPLGDDGASALFYNPAAIAKIKKPGFELLNLSFYANEGFTQAIDLNFFKQTSLSSFLPVLQAHPGTFVSSGISLLPTFFMNGFSFGILYQIHQGAVVNPDGTVSYKSQYQFVPTVGTGIRLASGIVRLGYSFQWVNSAAGTNTVSAAADPLGYNQGIPQGSAFSHNFGFALTLPYAYLPAVNLVARNVLGASYNSFTLTPLGRNPSGVPATEPTTFDGSFSIQPKLGGGSYVNLVFEYRDIAGSSGVPFMGRFASGLELAVKNIFFVRGGWGSGYPALGVGLRRKGGEFNLTWHSEEVGGAYLSQRDTRFLLHYQVRAF